MLRLHLIVLNICTDEQGKTQLESKSIMRNKSAVVTAKSGDFLHTSLQSGPIYV